MDFMNDVFMGGEWMLWVNFVVEECCWWMLWVHGMDVVDKWTDRHRQIGRGCAWMDAMYDTLLMVRRHACLKNSGSYASGA